MNVRSLVFIFCGLLLGYFFYPGMDQSKQISESKEGPVMPNIDLSADEIFIPKNDFAQFKDKANSKFTSEAIEIKVENAPSPQNEGEKVKSEFDFRKQVRFKVVDNFAVAAEDVLLGQPKDKTISGGVAQFKDEVKLWVNGDIPYAFDVNLPRESKEMVLRAISEFSMKTAIRFIPYSDEDQDFIVFSPSEELCASYVGRIGGAQPILLRPECGETQIMHEIMHALGFIHEHQRDIRDQYINVQHRNIQEDKMINFDIFPSSFQKLYRRSNELDTKSLMIYSSKAFVTDPTLDSMILKNTDDKIGDNHSLSLGDIEKIDNVYFRKF